MILFTAGVIAIYRYWMKRERIWNIRMVLAGKSWSRPHFTCIGFHDWWPMQDRVSLNIRGKADKHKSSVSTLWTTDETWPSAQIMTSKGNSSSWVEQRSIDCHSTFSTRNFQGASSDVYYFSLFSSTTTISTIVQDVRSSSRSVWAMVSSKALSTRAAFSNAIRTEIKFRELASFAVTCAGKSRVEIGEWVSSELATTLEWPLGELDSYARRCGQIYPLASFGALATVSRDQSDLSRLSISSSSLSYTNPISWLGNNRGNPCPDFSSVCKCLVTSLVKVTDGSLSCFKGHMAVWRMDREVCCRVHKGTLKKEPLAFKMAIKAAGCWSFK